MPGELYTSDELMSKEELKVLYDILNSKLNTKKIKIECCNNNEIIINDYGKHFAKICL